MGHQSVVFGDSLPEVGAEICCGLEEFVVHIHRYTTEASVAVGQTRSCDQIQDVENLLSVIEGIQEGSDPAQVEQVRTEPQQVAGDPVQLAGNDADVLGPFGDLDLHGLFDSLAVTEVVDHARQVVDTAGVGQELQVVAVFRHLLMGPVPIADDGLGLEDAFTFHVQPQSQHAMGGRMLWAHVHVVRVRIGRIADQFHARRRLRHSSPSPTSPSAAPSASTTTPDNW